MNNDIDPFNGPHYVLLTFERDRKFENSRSFSADLIRHIHYYQSLQKSSKLISYGEVISRPALCLILLVNSSDDFEQIIKSDPILKSGVLRIKDVVPFIHNGTMTMAQSNYNFQIDIQDQM